MQMFNNINDMYYKMVYDIMRGGSSQEVNGTREVLDRVYRLTDITNPVISIRNISRRYVAAELLWYLSGDNSVDFIGKYASMWNRITDDRKTNNSAYGYIIKYKHGFDQLEKIIELLKVDPYSRRAVININVPNENVIETKDEMCTVCLQFLVRDNKVHLTVVMRSNDTFFGFPMDVVYFCELQKYVADRLGYEYGNYTHHAISLHIYERDYDKFNNILDTKKIDDKPFTINHKKLWEHYSELFDDVKRNYSEDDKDYIVRKFYEYGIYEDVN